MLPRKYYSLVEKNEVSIKEPQLTSYRAGIGGVDLDIGGVDCQTTGQ